MRSINLVARVSPLLVQRRRGETLGKSDDLLVDNTGILFIVCLFILLFVLFFCSGWRGGWASRQVFVLVIKIAKENSKNQASISKIEKLDAFEYRHEV